MKWAGDKMRRLRSHHNAFSLSSFRSGGKGYCIKSGEDIWHLYSLQSDGLNGENKFVRSTAEPDQTIEILMSDLDPEVMDNFRKERFFKAEDVTKV